MEESEILRFSISAVLQAGLRYAWRLDRRMVPLCGGLVECALNDFSIVFFMIGERHLEHILCKGIDIMKKGTKTVEIGNVGAVVTKWLK